jgi:myo-inositol-1(or 4)-monophosphatase
MDVNAIKRTAIAAAHGAAGVLLSHLGNIKRIDKKSAIDLVTEADIQSEAVILACIRAHYPDHAILAEESGMNDKDSDFQWFVDPLDGTTNYAHQLGHFAVSIAFAYQGQMQVGVVLNPVGSELYTAVAGQGAWLNGKPIRVSGQQKVSESLLVTGFPYSVHENPTPIIKRMANCLQSAQGVRRLGAAALDLCYVACGRFDGFWEQHLKPWDTAAGALIAGEAGSRVTDFGGAPFTVDMPEILATNGHIHAEMTKLLQI